MAVAVAASFIVAACSDTPLVPELPGKAPPLPVALEWQHPLPQGNDLRRMWGFADGTFYAAGEAGTVVHFDGSTFAIVNTPARGTCTASGRVDRTMCMWPGSRGR